MRRPLALLALAALLPAAAAARPGQSSTATYVLDAKGDVRGPLDLVRVAIGRSGTRRLRGEITMRRRWDASDLGPRDSVCLKLYVRAEPDAEPPDYLVCATANADGDDLTGSVLRNRANGLPRELRSARVTRPTRRTVYLRFPISAIKAPDTLEFSGEAVTHGEDCPRSVGCMDLGPDAPATRRFRLHREASSG